RCGWMGEEHDQLPRRLLDSRIIGRIDLEVVRKFVNRLEPRNVKLEGLRPVSSRPFSLLCNLQRAPHADEEDRNVTEGVHIEGDSFGDDDGLGKNVVSCQRKLRERPHVAAHHSTEERAIISLPN
ncbi:MAG: hypothetical protein QOI27_168, partial [Gaiellaceae bacterium]|nr:hypothetical protein [Gaiellaceae bacterium]